MLFNMARAMSVSMEATMCGDACCFERVECSMSCVACCVVDDETASCDLPSDDEGECRLVALCCVRRWGGTKRRCVVMLLGR